MLRYVRIFALSITNQRNLCQQGIKLIKSDSTLSVINYSINFRQSFVTNIDKHVATYEEVARSVNKSKKIIVDVRNPDEIKSTGQIPSSINIPLKHVQEVLGSMSEAEFQRKYHRPKPALSDELIFYCRSGKRATEATNVALKLGYTKSKKFLPGWDGWTKGKQ